MELKIAVLSDGTTIRYVRELIGTGSGKEAYFTEDRSSVVCLYKKPDDDAVMRRRRLEKILGEYNPTVADKSAAYWKELYGWPTGLIEKPCLGVLYPIIPKNFFFENGVVRGKMKIGSWYWGKKTSGLVDQSEKGTWRDFLAGCLVLTRAVGRLHRAGLAHADLCCNNVLLDPLTQKVLLLTDAEDIIMPELFPPQVLGTIGYIAPEVLETMHLPVGDPDRKLPSVYTNRHALAVLIYQYLLSRHPLYGPMIHSKDPDEDERLSQGKEALFIENPSDKSNRPTDMKIPFTVLGNQLSNLFLQAFVDGLHDPDKRPTAPQWESALVKTWDKIIPCSNARCTHKSFVLNDPANVRCPFCGEKSSGIIPVLNLFTELTPGQWQPDGELVIHSNTALCAWHVHDNVQPGPDADRSRQAYFAFHNGNWIMINEKLQSLTSATGNPVAPGKAVALTDGAQIRFSKDPNGRMAEVKLIPV